MIKAEITLTDDTLEQVRAALEYFTGNNGKTIAPNTAKAFNQAVRIVQKSWQNWAMGGSLDGALPIKKPSANLTRSIKVKFANDFSAEVYTESQQMERIQKGTDDYDMKNERYYAGKKSRVRKDGVPYVIIPLKWGTPNKDGTPRAHFSLANTIPFEVYRFVEQKRKFARSERLASTHLEPNARGEMIERHEYRWGDTVDGVNGNVSGLYAFPDITHGSKYFTFRIISAETKKGWIRKGVPANDVAGALAKAMQPQVEELLQAGLEADLDL